MLWKYQCNLVSTFYVFFGKYEKQSPLISQSNYSFFDVLMMGYNCSTFSEQIKVSNDYAEKVHTVRACTRNSAWKTCWLLIPSVIHALLQCFFAQVKEISRSRLRVSFNIPDVRNNKRYLKSLWSNCITRSKSFLSGFI